MTVAKRELLDMTFQARIMSRQSKLMKVELQKLSKQNI